MKKIKLLSVLFATLIVFSSCNEDHDHNHDHEEELITTIIYTLTGPSNMVTLQWEDVDGDTGNPPVITVTGNFLPNTTYTGTIQLLNKTKNPADDITLEIQNEADEHEFFYSTTIANLSITKTDVDSKSNPLGIQTRLVSGSTGTGTITVVLKHEPKKPNNGTLADAGGSTDAEVTFNVSVQ